ncbi:MAG: SDR family NAD(P)-dependent oxidoreductase [Alphaproteobacteria bacterium]
MMKILVTGAAGFIGFHVCQDLLAKGHTVIGIDNLNPYYDPALKKARLAEIGDPSSFTFIEGDINDAALFKKLAADHADVTHVVHLAAQAGVRYSLEAPETYIQSNIVGLFNVLEFMRGLSNFQHFVFSSSSSVYGNSPKFPLSVEDRTDAPISLYAATKKSGEAMAHSYSHLFDIPTTILRFFTVYGPWGRPDMAPYIFTKCIHEGTKMPLYDNGQAVRSFTYIDDITDGVVSSLSVPPKPENAAPYRILNIGNDQTNPLKDLITAIEDNLGKKAILDPKPAQPGDVKKTAADIDETRALFGFDPKTSLEEGVAQFVAWYKKYHNI